MSEESSDEFFCQLCDYTGTEVQVTGHIGGKHVRRVRPIKHGTTAGYQVELRRKLPTCPACRAAWRRYYRSRNNSKPAGLEHLQKLIRKKVK